MNYLHSYSVYDGHPVLIKDASAVMDSATKVYEVIKIIGGIPLFLEDHFQRLQNSLKITGLSLTTFTVDDIRNQIFDLCEKNQIYFGNIELMVYKTHSENEHHQIGFIPHVYPSPEAYLKGVNVDVLPLERSQPNAKVKDTPVRDVANQYINDKQVFEVLLANASNQITEGSRSNVFFIIDNQIITAPDAMVLKGISRNYVMQVIKEQDLELVEKAITVDELHLVESAFLCGTSPGVIPIGQINQKPLDVRNLVVKSIMLGFNFKVQAYLSTISDTHYSHR